MKRNNKRLLLVLLGIFIGFIIGLLISSSTLNANPKLDSSDKAVMSKHGYGVYLQFEYEIVTHSYGTFVVVKPKNNVTDNFHVAGL